MTEPRERADPFAHLDAAYVMGALTPDDEAAFAEHLAGCPACAASVRELDGMPALLDAVPPDDAVRGPVVADPAAALMSDAMAADGPPPSILSGVLARAAETDDVPPVRRLRRRWAAAVAGVAAAAALLLAVTVGGLGRSTEPPATVAGPMEQVGQTALSASVQLTSVRWGTRIELECEYAQDGYPAASGSGLDVAYALVVTDADGEQDRAATWTAVPGRTLTVPAATALTADEITRVDVEAPDGTVVLTLTP